jgi:hypothetical protein
MSVLVADFVTDKAPLGHIGANRLNRILEKLLKDLTGIVRINNGELNQTLSTGLMCSFTRADDAIVAAATMHQIMETHPPETWENFDSPGAIHFAIR